MKEVGSYYSQGYKEGIETGVKVVGSAGQEVVRRLTQKGSSYRNEGIARKWGRRALFKTGVAKHGFVMQLLHELDTTMKLLDN